MGVSPARLKVVEQHAEEAAFLWTQRDRAVNLPQFDLFSLSRLDNRVEAHLDGLRIAGESGWDAAWSAAESVGRTGEVFSAGVLAFEEEAPRKIEGVLALAASQAALSRSVISALGWVPFVQSGRLIRTLLDSESPVFQRIGIAGSLAHRKNPGVASLTRALGSTDIRLKSRALRAIGELGLADMQLALRANIKTADPLSRFWGAWSLALLSGNPDASAFLQNVAESKSRFALQAATMASRRLPARDVRIWLMKLVREKNLPRVAVAVAGALGEPEMIPWLIDQCKVPILARPAAEAICLITGLHLDMDKLAGEPPQSFDAGPNDNPDDGNVAPDPDEPLAWPNPQRIKAWWDAKKSKFAKETRYLLGRPISADSLREALKSSFQRQRHAAATELAILKPGQPLANTRAPGFVQQAVWDSPR